MIGCVPSESGRKQENGTAIALRMQMLCYCRAAVAICCCRSTGSMLLVYMYAAAIDGAAPAFVAPDPGYPFKDGSLRYDACMMQTYPVTRLSTIIGRHCHNSSSGCRHSCLCSNDATATAVVLLCSPFRTFQ